MTDRRQADDQSALYEQVDSALTAALFRPLTEDEIALVRYAAGVPAGKRQDETCEI